MTAFEQISLFGERDPFSVAVEGIRQMYEWSCKHGEMDFGKWLLHHFSSYCGGTADSFFEGYDFADFSPKGLRLYNYKREGHKDDFVPKAKLLRYFQVKDDKKDVLRDYKECPSHL